MIVKEVEILFLMGYICNTIQTFPSKVIIVRSYSIVSELKELSPTVRHTKEDKMITNASLFGNGYLSLRAGRKYLYKSWGRTYLKKLELPGKCCANKKVGFLKGHRAEVPFY